MREPCINASWIGSFGELIGDIMEVYVDDVVVKSTTTEDHPQALEKKCWERCRIITLG